MIDLHTHSTASDGTFKPNKIIAAAEDLGLTAVALTDHDTLDGIGPFMDAARRCRTRAIPGVEIACSWYGGSLHIVGLFVDPDDQPLRDLLATVRQARDTRNTRILRNLRNLGYEISEADLLAEAGGGVPGRPHIAAAVVEKGYFTENAQVFRALLSKGGPAYVRRYLPRPSVGIGAIHRAGGVAVWAHPAGGYDVIAPSRIRQVARTLKSQGLDAMEVFYCDHTPRQQEACGRIARELNLLASGGSDFHGRHMPKIRLGTGFGSLAVPDELLGPLENKAAEHAASQTRH